MKSDKLEELFRMQSELNDRIFSKKNITDNFGQTLTTETLKSEANQGDLGPNGITNQWLGNFLAALNDESRELKEELLWKWWSKDRLDLQNIRVEIIDQLHFWISLALTAGLDADKVFSIYQQKNAINHTRQEKDYSKITKDETDNEAIN